jgi:hypothetical protein
VLSSDTSSLSSLGAFTRRVGYGSINITNHSNLGLLRTVSKVVTKIGWVLEVGSTANLFCNLRWRAAGRLFIETIKWEKEPKISIKDMLQLPEMAFEKERIG